MCLPPEAALQQLGVGAGGLHGGPPRVCLRLDQTASEPGSTEYKSARRCFLGSERSRTYGLLQTTPWPSYATRHSDHAITTQVTRLQVQSLTPALPGTRLRFRELIRGSGDPCSPGEGDWSEAPSPPTPPSFQLSVFRSWSLSTQPELYTYVPMCSCFGPAWENSDRHARLILAQDGTPVLYSVRELY